METENHDSLLRSKRRNKRKTIDNPPWAALYEGALLEFDSKKLIERIGYAETAIEERLYDLRLDSNHHAERQMIQDAQGALRFLRRSASNKS
jgi:chemotaxis regulatin CheY-phosphate phosphatase CheZ